MHARKKKPSSICARSLRMATLSLNTVMACVRLGLSACEQIHSSVFSELVYTRSPAERREAASASSTRCNARPDAKAVRSENALRSTGCCEDSSHSSNCGEAYGSSRMTMATPFSSGQRKRGPLSIIKRVYPHQRYAAPSPASSHAKSSARPAWRRKENQKQLRNKDLSRRPFYCRNPDPAASAYVRHASTFAHRKPEPQALAPSGGTNSAPYA